MSILKAQLSQTLFSHSVSQPTSTQQLSRKRSFTQPCNTPTMSPRFTWVHMTELQRQFAVSSDGKDELEDERMVEELLVPSSPVSANASTSQFSPPSSSVLIPQRVSMQCYTPTEPSPSSFTSTDPFYLAQSEAMQSCSTPPRSTFAQFGLPSQQSPFVMQEQLSQHRRDIPGYIHSISSPLPEFPDTLFVTTLSA